MEFPKFSRSPIDIHSHFNHGVEGDSQNPSFKGTHQSALDFLKSEYDRFCIKEVAFSTYSSVLSSSRVAEENEYMRQLAAENDWIYQWVVIHPLQKETYAQADEMLREKKCLGIKIHPYFHKYDISEYADDIFSFANERGATVKMHPAKMEEMAGFANKYPNMKLIIAHLSEEAHIDAIKDAKHGNIYTDTSGSLSALNNVIEYACEQVGADKILFGTDTYSPAFQYSRVALARISHEEKEKILFKNAIEMFPRAFK